MAALGADQNQGFEDEGFDYVENGDNNEGNVFEDSNMGGLGDAMGLDNDDNLLAMEEELNKASTNKDGTA